MHTDTHRRHTCQTICNNLKLSRRGHVSNRFSPVPKLFFTNNSCSAETKVKMTGLESLIGDCLGVCFSSISPWPPGREWFRHGVLLLWFRHSHRLPSALTSSAVFRQPRLGSARLPEAAIPSLDSLFLARFSFSLPLWSRLLQSQHHLNSGKDTAPDGRWLPQATSREQPSSPHMGIKYPLVSQIKWRWCV